MKVKNRKLLWLIISLTVIAGAGLYLPKNAPNVVNSVQDFDPIDRFLWANLPFAITHNGSRRFTPADRTIDGVDLMPYAAGKKAGFPHKNLFFRSGNYRVLLSDDWKLQVDDTQKKIWLFDMAHNPTEQKDLAVAEPARVAALQAELAGINGEQVRPLWPSLIEGCIDIDVPLGLPENGKGEYVYWAN